MPRFRRYRKKRITYRKRRTMRRKSRKTSISTHRYKLRCAELSNLQLVAEGTNASFTTTDDYWNLVAPTAGAASPVIFCASMAFSIQDIFNASDFLNIYDQYRINKVTIKIIPMSNESDSPKLTWVAGVPSVGSENVVAIIHDAIDFNDFAAMDASNPQLAIGKLRRYPTYRERNFYGRHHIRSFKPHLGVDALDTKGNWITSNAPNEPYYGYKFIMEMPNLPNQVTTGGVNSYTFGFKVLITYDCEFRYPN